MVSSLSPDSVELRTDFELVAFEAQADGAGALVGKLRDALDGRGQFTGAHHGELGVVARHHGLKVGELAGELARAQGAMADAEEQRVLVVGKLDLFGIGVRQQLLQLLQGLARNEHALFAADAFEGFVGLFDKREAMAVGRDHGQRLGLDDQQRAVERVARFFVGDGEDGARDERLERDRGMLVAATEGNSGTCG